MRAAIDYVPRWLEFQMRLTEQPGCAVAIAHRGTVVLDQAFGHADLPGRVALTPAHRFRVASHSKTFTAAGILKLREQGRLRLDDPIGTHLGGLHPRVAEATLAQLLSHSAGLVRDGTDAGQWADRRAFLDEAELRADLAGGPTIEANTRFKYSNHGFGLLGLAIEAVTGERYVDWIEREVVAAAGLTQTQADAPALRGAPFARGHTGRLPLGRRLAIAGDNPTRALAAATGFVSTAGDLARFFGSLAPSAKRSVLASTSRREMTRRQWRDAHASVERWYGLGTLSGRLGDWDWFGHSGGFQGTLTRTVCVPEHELAVSVLTNAADGPSQAWLDGVLHILQAHRRHGAPSRRAMAWQGRWWTLWGAFDLLPMNGKVLVANPALPNPLLDASEIEPLGRGRDGVERGRIVLASGLGNHGEPARIERDRRGLPSGFWLAGMKLLPEGQAAKELTARYAPR
jgi:D-alanyl-D-alanine carboxypeptidase